MGEGYRLVAASAGVRPEEKAAITRNSPSHGGLCGTEPEAKGLAGYPLPTGRYCVACSCYAGQEQSARGGGRVYTSIVLLQRAQFARFGADPLLVAAALTASGSGGIQLDLRPVLEPLPFVDLLSAAVCSSTRRAGADARELPLHAISAVLAGRRIIVAGAAAPDMVLKEVVAGLPLFVRVRWGFSLGLRYAPSRPYQLCLLDRDQGETQRVIRGHDVCWVDAAAVSPAEASAFDTWLTLVREWGRGARRGDLEHLLRELTQELGPEDLSRVVEICRDADRVRDADECALQQLQRKYQTWRARNDVETRRREQLLAAAERRAAELEANQPVPADS
jgi:hypothetical protein